MWGKIQHSLLLYSWRESMNKKVNIPRFTHQPCVLPSDPTCAGSWLIRSLFKEVFRKMCSEIVPKGPRSGELSHFYVSNLLIVLSKPQQEPTHKSMENCKINRTHLWSLQPPCFIFFPATLMPPSMSLEALSAISLLKIWAFIKRNISMTLPFFPFLKAIFDCDTKGILGKAFFQRRQRVIPDLLLS